VDVSRNVLVQPGARDLVIQAMPWQAAPRNVPGLVRNQPAASWEVETWLEKSFPKGMSSPPKPVRYDGKWTVLVLLPDFDSDILWDDLAKSIRQMGAQPVVIWGDRVDHSLPEHLLTEHPLDIPMAIDRYGGRAGATSDEYRIGNMAAEPSVILIDPKGVVRAFDYFRDQKVDWEKFRSLIISPPE